MYNYIVLASQMHTVHTLYSMWHHVSGYHLRIYGITPTSSLSVKYKKVVTSVADLETQEAAI
jgi:hypothetical protein